MSGVETELKLAATPEAIAAILADPVFFGPAAKTREQVSTYHDTPNGALRAAGLSLRIRRIGERRVQTIKAEGAAAASLFARDEWEMDVAGDVPVLDEGTAALATALGGPAAGDLAPVFATEVTRTAIDREEDGSVIELVADRGRIVAEGREAPIGELELELKAGDRRALFTAARTIAARVPVRLGVRSKSERGYALLAGEKAKSVKGGSIRLGADLTAADAFAAIAGECIRLFRRNEDLLLASGRPEALHQARVAIRRLRSALTIFRDMLAGPRLDWFRAELRWLAALLGEVRNIDVLIPRIDDAAAIETLRAARDRAMNEVLEALDGARVRALILDLVEWIDVGAWREDAGTAELRGQPAAFFARDTLDRLRRRMKKQGRDIASLDEAARHEVRILGKKLRYAAEFFAGLFAGKKAARRRDRFLAEVAAVQEALGELNDLASGRDLLARLGIVEGETLLAGRRKSAKKLLAGAEAAYESLIDEKRFWK